MTGPRPVALGLELVVHHAVAGFLGPLQPILLAEPVLDSERTGTARWGRPARFALLEHDRWEGLLARRRPRLFVGQEGCQPAVARAAEPRGHAMTVEGQMGSGLAP